ncbi:GNAT family N-acetyltransferase [Solidesulfovibrio alcoholivorans]|uniref:GNAT family N-acetyltransferase n=1 Tax=Solidesulfovibrio alcoholivorans TaxID=81406 RepID=UPI00049712CD|nr:GNAT family N-acetyltransferase [Solidesulfovibrio alcoholivorans]
MPPRITAATPDEYPALAELWEASVRATHSFVTEADIRVFKPLVRDTYLAAVALRCARDVSGAALGFVGVAAGKIEMLFVAPACFGQGIGSALLTCAVETLGATDVDVNEQNAAALAFYKRRGFTVVGRSPCDGQGKPYPLLHMTRTR